MTPAQAALELLKRRRGRASLAGYTQAIEIPGKPATEDPDEEIFEPIESNVAAHHRLICEAFERTAARRHGRLMIFMPPGSAKSTYGTVVGPTYIMGKKPGTKVILASYGQDLARRHGRRARQIVKQEAYSGLWSGQFGNPKHVGINPNSFAADEWSLTNGSEYLACGILSGITGNRAHGIVIDDPIKGREQADSPTIRKKTKEAYQDDLLTRLIPGGWVVLIQTRWHEDDLAGGILPKGYAGESGMIECQDGKVWEVINLPAECERLDDPLKREIGAMLWPEWFDKEHWAIFRKQSRTWAALYQQRPRPDEGGIFKEAWVKRHKTAPAEGMIVQSCDSAYKPAQVNDPSVISTWLVTRQRHYLLHVWRDRVDYPTLKRMAINLAWKWKPNALLIEDKASGQSLIQELRNGAVIEEGGKRFNFTPPVIAIEPEGDKLTRANTVSSMVEAGLVSLPEVADWLVDFEGEFFGFPLTTNDDQVDSTTQFLKWVSRAAISLVAHGSGNLRAGIGGFDDNPSKAGSQIDESRGFGTVRSTTDMSGF